MSSTLTKTEREHELGCPAIQAWDIPNACNCQYPLVTRCTRCARRVRRPDAGCVRCDKPAEKIFVGGAMGDDIEDIVPAKQPIHSPEDQALVDAFADAVGAQCADDIHFDEEAERKETERCRNNLLDALTSRGMTDMAELWRNKYNEIRAVMIEVADENVARRAKLKKLQQFVAEQAEEDCSYRDRCPRGTRHGTCYGCKARNVLYQIKEQNDTDS